MKLSAQSQNNAIWGAFSILDRVASRIQFFKAIDPPGPAARKVRDLGIKLIVRHYGDWDNDWGAFEPAAFVESCKAQDWWPYAWAVESPNEPHPGDPGKMTELVFLLLAEGRECIVGNWGTGWSGFFVPGAKLYGVHEYGAVDLLDQSPYQALRYRSWFPDVLSQEPEATLFITECGVTQAATGGPDIGYKSHGQTGSHYWYNSLLPYSIELDQDEYVEKAFIFLAGAADKEKWDSFDILGTEIENLLVNAIMADAPTREAKVNNAQIKECEELAGVAWGWKEFAERHAQASASKGIEDSAYTRMAAEMLSFANRIRDLPALT